ncbi:MAG TPA: AzlC family ABC transporter permease [Acidimicrobiia bacterium]|nr:AzlC family ABC transporter permease [Acidimicrobiia bacterium]
MAPPIGVFGFVFGALAVQVGLAPWQAVLTSMIVISGAAQLAMVTLVAAGPGAVLIAATGLALRHLPMSATLSHLIGPTSLRNRLQLAWVLVDETFALTLNASRREERDLVSFKSGADLVLYTTWMSTTLAGALLGARIDATTLGLEIVFPLVFLGMALPLIKDRRHLVTAALAVGASLLAVQFLPTAWQVSVAALAAAALGSRVR